MKRKAKFNTEKTVPNSCRKKSKERQAFGTEVGENDNYQKSSEGDGKEKPVDLWSYFSSHLYIPVP